MTASSSDDLARAQAEIDRLKRENERLQEARSHKFWWVRSTAVVVLMTLGFVLLPVAGLAVWSRNTLLDTDRYVETVAPLSESDEVVNTVADAITNAIFEKVDVEQLVAENLPPRLTFAAGPITSQIQSSTRDLIVRALESDRFTALWQLINRQASASVVAFVTGSNTTQALSVENGRLILDLKPIVDDVKAQLSGEGLDFVNRLPSIDRQVTLPVANIDYLLEARTAVDRLNTLAYVLPWIVALLFLGAVLLARNRRRAVIWAGSLIAGAALLVGLALAIGRGLYLDSVTSETLNRDTAAVVFDTLVRFLRNGIRVIFLVGLIIALTAALTGPSSWALSTRRFFGDLLNSGARRSNFDTGQFGTFFARYRRALQITAAVIFAAMLFIVDLPTPSTVAWLVVGLLLTLAVIQFLAATAPAEKEESSNAPAVSEGRSDADKVGTG